MKLVLVAIHSHPSPQAVPLACAFLKGAVLAEPDLASRVETEILEFFPDHSPERCAAEILALEPDAVGISVYLWGSTLALGTARLLRERRPDLFLFAGGAEATAHGASLLAAAPFDCVVCGEGEGPLIETLGRLLDRRPLDGIPGVLHRGARGTTPAAAVPLESIPSPYLAGVIEAGPARAALWQLSRGCDFTCAFCFDGKSAVRVRRVPLERVAAELSLFVEQRVTQVVVLDSTFNKVPERAKEILRLIRKTAPGIHFHFEVRSEFLDREMAELFASITCSLQIGLQSAHTEVLAAVGRGFDAREFRRKVAFLNESGAIFGFDLIYGLPGDTLERFRDSLDFALSLYPNHLDIFPLAVLPGTRLHAEGRHLGLRHLPEPPYTISATSGFSAAQVEKARRLARACDIFYSRGKAVAWFNSVCRALELSPAPFLEAFADWCELRGDADEAELSDREVWQRQRAFLTEIFKGRKKGKLLPLALNLADYHHHYAEALTVSPPDPPARRAVKRLDILGARLALAPSATLARFDYPILELLEAGEVDLPLFAAQVRQGVSCALIYPYRGEVCTEEVDPAYLLLLERLDGTIPAREACAAAGVPAEAAQEFLEFALLQGIVVRTA